MMITKLKILGLAAVACILTVGGIHTFARQVGGPGRTSSQAAADSQSDDGHSALVRTVDKLQADLDKSVQLNAQLQKELDQLRVSLEALRGKQPAATPKSPPGKAEAEIPAKAEEPQASYIQAGVWLLAASAHGDKVVAYNVKSGETRSLDLQGERVKTRAIPIDGNDLVVYSLGRHVCAFSMQTKSWDVVELPEGETGTPSMQPGSATLRWKNHIYIFSSEMGKWKHIDLDAITAGGNDEEKENTKPQK